MSAPSPDDATTAHTIRVVGGTYREVCDEPPINALRGSGLRAAALLASMGNKVTFETCLDTESSDEAAALADAFNIRMNVQTRQAPLTFAYETPVSPAQWTRSGPAVDLHIRAPQVVAYGMVDARWQVDADMVVIDPQHADLDRLLAAVSAREIALVLNVHEAARHTQLPLPESGHALLARDVDVVIVKQGALGGHVFTRDHVTTYGPIPTSTTHAIGSGDAFTAGFADAWFRNPTDAGAAAEAGARVAAAHSTTDNPQITAAMIAALPAPLMHPGLTPPRIYLAAPFFTVAERMLLTTARTALLDAGLDAFSPFHDVGTGGDEVATADLDGLRQCSAVLALLDGADPGTIFETGWATHADIPVVGFTAHPDNHDWTMLRGTGAQIVDDLTSAIYTASWAGLANHRMTAP